MITAFGDSIVQSIVDLCGRKLGTSTTNYARVGGTAPLGEQMVERYEERLNNNQIVLMGYGGNDSDYEWSAIAVSPEGEYQPRTSLNDFVCAYTRIIDRVRSAGATPVLLSMPPVDGDRYFNFFSRYWTDEERENVMNWMGGDTTFITTEHQLYNTTTRKIAQEQGVEMIDITADFLNKCDYQDYLDEDGVHPNEKGQRRIADLIVEHLQENVLPLAS